MAAPVYVCIWYDTEDYVTPSSDDSALRLAELHSRLGLPATFKVVGEKARVLAARGRTDVLRALARHDVGYHTNYHSVHPTVPEYCDPLPWSEGVGLFRHLEEDGLTDVTRLLGQRCSTFGQAGGAWAPQMYPTLVDWGIPTYVDEGVWIGLNGQPFWYMGLLHVMRMESSSTRFRLREPRDELDGTARFSAAARRLADLAGGIISIYFHPCEWNTDAFWDGVNFARGANPPLHRLKLPPETPAVERERRFLAMETYLSHIAAGPAVGITCAELPRLYPDRAKDRALTRDRVVEATADWSDGVNFVATEHGWLSAGELLTVVAGLLCPGPELPPAAAGRIAVPLATFGPTGEVPPLTAAVTVPFQHLVDGAGYLLCHCCPGRRRPAGGPSEPLSAAAAAVEARPAAAVQHRMRYLPAAVPLGTLLVRPEEYLLAALRALRTAVSTGEPPSEVEVSPAAFRPADHVRHPPGAFGWSIFPEGFDAPHVMTHARRQTWTLKPAVLQPRER